MRGIIYKYESPSGKVYIGQTFNEKKRRNVFLNENLDYAGVKINEARKKYGANNFTYEIIETVENSDIKVLTEELNRLECYYINLYDSFKNGYNMSIGGNGSRGYQLTESHKEKIKNYLIHCNPFKGKKHTDNTKKTISLKNSKPVRQIDVITNKTIKIHKSAKEAGVSLGKPRGNSEIIKVCKKYISPSGKKYLTALGYKWEYYNEGSTTTETTLKNVME